MSSSIPSEFDVIVVGTGLIESILASAAARIGKTVFHVDTEKYYGGLWTTFTLKDFEKWIKNQQHLLESDTFVNQNDEHCKSIRKYQVTFIKEYICDEKNVNKYNKFKIVKNEEKKIYIDLAPKVLYASGALTDLLLSSNSARYLEFKCLTRIFIFNDEKFVLVPCSRADIFASKEINILEKRQLMKFIQEVNDTDNFLNEYEDNAESFVDYLKSKQLSPVVQQCVFCALANMNEFSFSNTKKIIKNIKTFIRSAGKYGSTPYLLPLFGTGELTQAFCRLCAVYGGIYHLNFPISKILANKNNICVGIMSDNNKTYSCRNLILSSDLIPYDLYRHHEECNISRAVLITDQSIKLGDKTELSLLHMPVSKYNSVPLILLEIEHTILTNMDKIYLIHIIAKQQLNAEKDFKDFISHFFQLDEFSTSKPNVLYAAFFNHKFITSDELHWKNVWSCTGPGSTLDFTWHINKAREIFNKLYPNLEFLPRIPDPDEIILEEHCSTIESGDTEL